MMNAMILCSVIHWGTQKPPVLDIPSEPWVEVFFNPVDDSQSINGRAKVSGLQDLQKKSQPVGVTEVRIWEGFGVTYLEGYRFRLEGNRWRGWWIQPLIKDRSDWKAIRFLHEFSAPTIGWQAFWKTLVDNDLLTLRDFSSLPGQKPTFLDGVSYVVELSSGGRYRTYHYDNPHAQRGDWPEVKKMRAIVKAVHDAFRDQVNR